jgi:hypothetical protein
MTALVGGIVLIAVGQSAAGLVPLVTAIAGLADLFIYGERQNKRAAKRSPKPPNKRRNRAAEKAHKGTNGEPSTAEAVENQGA